MLIKLIVSREYGLMSESSNGSTNSLLPVTRDKLIPGLERVLRTSRVIKKVVIVERIIPAAWQILSWGVTNSHLSCVPPISNLNSVYLIFSSASDYRTVLDLLAVWNFRVEFTKLVFSAVSFNPLWWRRLVVFGGNPFESKCLRVIFRLSSSTK